MSTRLPSRVLFLFEIFLCNNIKFNFNYNFRCMGKYSDNDKDCPVCHSKYVQLCDALQAQSESQCQHEIFHNLLIRSREPFSVVAQYFGRGLFNEIVIIDEQDKPIDNHSKVISIQLTSGNRSNANC